MRKQGSKRSIWTVLAFLIFAVAFAIPCTAKINAFASPLSMPDGTVFDPVFYADSNPDLKMAYGYNGGALWKHYTTCGRAEGRAPSDGSSPVGSVTVMSDGTLFDANYYLNTYPDLLEAVGTDFNALWAHYSRCGRYEGRTGYPGQVIASTGNINTNVPYPYMIRVNRAAATVTIYGMDYSGAYSIPCRAFICSPGRATPIGTFRSRWNARWIEFAGNQYGQYAKNITQDFYFHSVMYNGKAENALDWPAYNRLGTVCSHGCVRLQAGDAKWIYDNCPVGTIVEIYDDASNPGPLGKPEVMKISGSDPRRGWDPTDPNPANAWWAVPETASAAQ